MAKDFLGNELNVGDEVAFMQGNYRNLMKGVIFSMGTVKITISYETDYGHTSKAIQFPNQVIKIVRRDT